MSVASTQGTLHYLPLLIISCASSFGTICQRTKTIPCPLHVDFLQLSQGYSVVRDGFILVYKLKQSTNEVLWMDAFSETGTSWHSIAGYFMFYEHFMLHTQGNTQGKIATSAPEAELFEMVPVSKPLIYMQGIMDDMGEYEVSLSILKQSQSSMCIPPDPVSVRQLYLSVYQLSDFAGKVSCSWAGQDLLSG